VHRSVKLNLFIGFSLEFIFGSKNFNNLFGQILLSVFSKIVLVDMFTNFKIKLDILDIFKLLFILSHSATNKTMLM